MTAELAVAHAKDTPREQSEPSNGVFGFDGQFISGNTTLHDLENEAARVLRWISPDSMDVDGGAVCVHDNPGDCSCHIAGEIERYGLSSTFHCRFNVDGTPCAHAECPYSHAELSDSTTAAPPHCSICMDALVFPCPACLARAQSAGDEPASVLFCPLVQNAGCGHLHHAHCVGPRNSPARTGCPSGCAAVRFPREAIDFQTLEPHLIVAWDGDKIDKIAVPFSGPASVTLTTDAIVQLVETFLQGHQFALPGLSLRVHFRDPVTESVTFTRSTLVSVCPSSSHLNQGHRRFDLFPTIVTKPIPQPAGPHSVDLHTAHAPIIACGCTPIKDLFSSSGTTSTTLAQSIVLYAVKRKTAAQAQTPDKHKTASKQAMYLADEAWQPSVTQTPRGMAALLSSLYLLSQSVPQKGAPAEQRVLALAYAVLRFSPAIRTLAGLLLNKVPRAEEKAALSEALFHALKEFSWRGPQAIISHETRRFETVRIFLAYLAAAADAVDGQSAAVPNTKRAVEEISLICTLSRKQLRDPVSLNSSLVERSVAQLHQPGGALYRPTPMHFPSMTELADTDIIKRVLPHLRNLPATSTVLLRTADIGAAPREMRGPLDSAARDFVAAIKRANGGELVSQGPLELKSVDVVPPRIVVDQEGLLAVFTGRGCGTTRDVNFFRPMNGGDTEVDVNDVSHAQQKIIQARVAEDTWQVDCFGQVTDISRPVRAPDEAIIMCLDLSESMNRSSGVQRSAHPAAPSSHFDPIAETAKIVREFVANMSEPENLQNANEYLESQDPSCHHPWATLVARPGAQGAVLFSQEDEAENVQDLTVRTTMEELSSFIFAATNASLSEQLRLFLVQLVRDSTELVAIGEEPYDVPRKFIDFRTGDLLTDPVHPYNAPSRTFVNRTSESWCEEGSWPMGHSVSANMSESQLKKAISTWVSGTQLLPKFKKNSKAPFVNVTLRRHREDISWKLSPETTTRTLYSLVNRATRAMHSKFTLKISASNNFIVDSSSLALEGTALANGGVVELVGCEAHTRGTSEFEIISEAETSPQRVVLPEGASLLALLSYIDAGNPDDPGLRMTEITLWHGLKDCGDGLQRGYAVETDDDLNSHIATPVSLECCRFTGIVPQGARRAREESKKLTRLHLLKELFNGSFDTTTSLVLGLVTFSAQASQEQDLTPIFENFRQTLERTQARGDTAIYDALDLARRTLTQYRTDLPNLRKRIVIVSDGEDTSSIATPREVTLALQRARVVVDSVQVGPQSDPVLHAISVATGGYRFSPRTSLADALSIFDLETMLYAGERPPRPRMPFVTSDLQLYNYQNIHIYPVDMITVDKFPPRAEHPLLKQPVKSAATSLGITGGGDDRLKRIMREIKAVVADPHPNIDVYFNDRDMSFLKVIVEAPKDVDNCPYKGGTFLLTCDLPTGYPRDPPEVRFVTFILHPNVSKQGKVCIAELGRLWSSDITLKEIFALVYGTLLTPDLENPLEIQASLKYYEDDGTYALAVADAIKAHASKTRSQWREELGGE
ncbi:putative bifunctional E2/E3 enzyme [Mycena venus]|uniref:Putative bifunctional E2/E3 enzyme n=1 Tax=Mycena venus TaxID=2733690 RepID=A0A8H6X7L1_9AGAR|nr:putative bifunctional E2/E3 enzyme [Mycena venus]